MNRAYFGVDCGKNGAIAWPDVDYKDNRAMLMPLKFDDKKKSSIDLWSLWQFLLRVQVDYQSEYNTRPFFVVEDPGHHAPSAAGLRSMTYSFSAVESLIVSCGFKHHTVVSRTWQKDFWTKPSKLSQEKYDTKKEALKAAQSIWPNMDFRKNDRSRIAHDGIVDACLLAEYGRRNNI